MAAEAQAAFSLSHDLVQNGRGDPNTAESARRNIVAIVNETADCFRDGHPFINQSPRFLRKEAASLIDVWREKKLSCGLHRSTACAAPILPAPWRFRCRRGLPPQRTHGSPDHSELRARDQDARPLQALPFRYGSAPKEAASLRAER